MTALSIGQQTQVLLTLIGFKKIESLPTSEYSVKGGKGPSLPNYFRAGHYLLIKLEKVLRGTVWHIVSEEYGEGDRKRRYVCKFAYNRNSVIRNNRRLALFLQ
jgi:hypothetical protein